LEKKFFTIKCKQEKNHDKKLQEFFKEKLSRKNLRDKIETRKDFVTNFSI